MTERGIIKFYDRARGYGFISRAGAPDVFLHNSVADRYRMHKDALERDAPVRFISKECDGRRPECVAIAAA